MWYVYSRLSERDHCRPDLVRRFAKLTINAIFGDKETAFSPEKSGV
jgi:hypothetical protein